MKLKKRRLIQSASFLPFIAYTASKTLSVMASPSNALTQAPTSQNLQSTPLIEANHPRIIALEKQICAGATNDQTAAILIHRWVRDQIAFGFPPGFYETSATQTLDEKVGYCNTKATLFSALLRARGIPTRLRMVDLSSLVLQGLLDPGTPYVDHGLTEVFLDGRWIKVDSYVVDKPLALAAHRRLAKTGAKAGFGVHVNGSSEWDGRSDHFVQYMDNDAIPNYVLKDHGLFVDVADFYQKVIESRNRKTLMSGLAIRLGSSWINRNVDQIRRET
jgi:transglutaminase-like putative cysteine protease